MSLTWFLLLCIFLQGCYSISFRYEVFQNGTSSNDFFRGVTLQNDFLFAVGSSAGSMFGPNIGNHDIILAKFNLNFTLISGIQIGTTNNDFAQSVVVHPTGDLVIGCGMWNYVESSSGDGTVFAVNSTNLQLLWRTDVADPSGYTWLWGVAMDTLNDETVYAGGYTNASVLHSQTAAGFSAVMAKLNSTDGTLLWVRVLGTSVEDRLYSIAVDQYGFIYGAGTGSTESDKDCALCKVDPNGNQIYYKIFGAPLVPDYSTGVAVDSVGNVYVLGVSYANYSRTGNAYPTPSSQQLLTVWSINSGDTAFNWVSQISSVGGSFVNTSQLIFASDGLLYTAAWADGVSVNGSLNNGASNSKDGLLTAWDADGNLKYVSMIGTSSDDALYGLCMGNQTLYIVAATTGNWEGNYTYQGTEYDFAIVRAVHNDTFPSPSATPFYFPLPLENSSTEGYIGSDMFIALVVIGAFVLSVVAALFFVAFCTRGQNCWKTVLAFLCCYSPSTQKNDETCCCCDQPYKNLKSWVQHHFCCCMAATHGTIGKKEPVFTQIRGLHFVQLSALAAFMLIIILFWSGWYVANPPNQVAFYIESPFETPDFYLCNPQQDPNYDLVPVTFASYTFTAVLTTEGTHVDETIQVQTNVTVFDQDGCLKFPSFLFKDLNDDPYRTVLDIDQILSCSVSDLGCSDSSPGYVLQYLFLSHRSQNITVIGSDVTYLSTGLNIVTFWVEKAVTAAGSTQWFYPTSAYLVPGTIAPTCNQTTCLFHLKASLRLRSGNVIEVQEAQKSDIALAVLVSTGSLLGTVGTLTALLCCLLKRKLFRDDKYAWFDPEMVNILSYHYEIHSTEKQELSNLSNSHN